MTAFVLMGWIVITLTKHTVSSDVHLAAIGGGFFGFLFSHLVISLERIYDSWNEKMNASKYIHLIFKLFSISIVSFVVNQTSVWIFLFFELK